MESIPGKRIYRYVFASLFFSLFLISSVQADVNISIQSDNNLSAQIKSISDYSVIGTINSTENINLPYNSYELEIMMDTTNLSYSNFWSFLGGLNNKFTFIVLMLFILFIIFGFMGSFKK